MRVPKFGVKPHRRVLAAVAGLLLTLPAAACGTSDPAAAGGAKPTTMTVATGFAIDDLDPMQSGFWHVEFGGAELLMRPVVAGAPEPWLLEDLQNVDEHTWVLSIKPDVKFQNGTPLDGQALAAVMSYSLQNVAGLKSLTGASIEATGEHEVTVTTPQPTPNLPYLLADESKFVIFDLAAYQAAGGDAQKLIAAQIYTGPYVVDSLDPQTMKMTADDDHWAGTPPLDSVTVKFIEQAQARILAVQNGEADLALYPPTDAATSIEGRTDSHWVTGEPKGPTFQLRLNQKTGPFTDPAVRKAVLDAIDYQELADDVMNGLYEVSEGMYSPNAPYYQPMYGTDIATAEKLLADAGWVKDGSEKLSKGGQQLTITMLTYPQQPDSDTLALAVQSQLDKLGITVQIQQVPDLDDAEGDPSFEWDAAVHGNGTTSFSGDPTTVLQSTFASDGPNNFAGINDPALDALIDQYATTMDPQERDAILSDIQGIIADNAYMGWLGARIPGVVTGPAWQGYDVPPANLWVGYTTKP